MSASQSQSGPRQGALPGSLWEPLGATGWLRWGVVALLVALFVGLAGNLFFSLAPERAAAWLGPDQQERLGLIAKGVHDASALLAVLALLLWLVAARRDGARASDTVEGAPGLRLHVLEELGALTGDGYCRTDTQGRFTESAGPLRAALGLRSDQILGRHIEDLPGFEADEVTRAALRARVTQREALPWVTFRALRADGKPIWLAYTSRPRFGPDGEFLGHEGVGRDMTEREEAIQRLRQSEERFRALTELATEWYWETDADLRITLLQGPWSNPSRREAVVGSTLSELATHPAYDVDAGEIDRTLRQRKSFRRLAYRVREKDGFVRYYESAGEPRFSDGRFVGYRGLSWDVSERETTIALLRQSEERFRALTELSSDWYWETDAELRLTGVRQGGTRALPFDPAAMIGRYRWDLPGDLVSPSTWDEHRADLHARRPFRDLIVHQLDANGKSIFTLSAGDPYLDAEGNFIGYRGIGRDITEQVRAQERIKWLATIDPLTQIYNRTTFEERAGRILNDTFYAQGKLAALLFVDLDHFRQLNNGYGHRVGDQMLATVAARMRAVLGEPHLIGRRGGDELVALLVDIPRIEVAVETAKTLITAIGEPARVLDMEVYVTPSIGIAMYPQDGVDLNNLLNAADAAMYQAKESGRRTYAFYTPAVARKREMRRRLEQRLRSTVEARDFKLFYQPLVSLFDGKMIGAECLIRWKDAELGEVPPDEFVKVAEESGLIVELGDWVLREACRTRQVWHRLGVDVPPLAINVAGAQLDQLSCVDRLLETLAEFGVAPSEIEIEVTETSLFRATGVGRENLLRLRNAGVKIALDDFGVGYSSLSHLREQPINRLKIDKSFTVECMKDARTLTIVKAVIEMARSLGIKVTAEGIETVAQQTWMQHLGCDSAQGFLFARPMPAEDFLKHFVDRRGVGRERSLMH